ncbi:MAG: alpha-galactosidase [Terriglobales bacterium]
MKQARRLAYSLGLAVLLLAGTALGSGYTDFRVLETDTHDVRFVSGRTVYVEGLVKGMWSGRYWSAGGWINVPYELSADDAFGLRTNDASLNSGWQWVGAHEEAHTPNGARHFVVELTNTRQPLSLRIHTVLDGTPILERWLEIKNTGQKPIALRQVFPWTSRLWRTPYYDGAGVPKDSAVFQLGSFTRITHGWEGWLQWDPLTDSFTHVESHVGHGFKAPFFLVRNQLAGEYFIGHLAWTANWDMDFFTKQEAFGSSQEGPGGYGPGKFADLFFKAGPWATLPLRVVSAGESVTSPAIHMGPVQGDLDSAVQAMHEHVRQTVMPHRDPKRAYLIEYAVPGDQGYIAKFPGDLTGMNEKNIYQQIDLAKELGAELFIVDAGWWDVYGEWTPSPSRFPHGLRPIADYIHNKGMLFGLYNEVEGGRGDWTHSVMYRQHPDWFIPPYALVDMTNPDAVAFVHQQIKRMVEDYKVDLFRLDYNPGFDYEMGQHTREGIAENDYWRQYEATYKLFEQVKAEFPQLILQQAAAGGGRNDLGFASRFDEQYTTDGLDMPVVLQNLSGQTLGLPIEMFATAYGIPAHSVNRGHLDTHLRVTFSLGTPWLTAAAPDLKDMNPEVAEEYHHYVGLYKNFIRPIMPTSRIYHHAPVNDQEGVQNPWFAMEFDSPDRTKGWATLVKLYPGANEYLFRPRGLDPGKSYKVTFDSLRSSAVISGVQLMSQGLPVHLESTLDSELLLFEAVTAP